MNSYLSTLNTAEMNEQMNIIKSTFAKANQNNSMGSCLVIMSTEISTEIYFSISEMSIKMYKMAKKQEWSEYKHTHVMT